MKICIITCHDVYNVGAGLQAYALSRYLMDAGYDVRIIDYKPEYLSRHYRLDVVSNPQYDRPVVRQLYLLAKLRGRLKRLHSRKKIEFDAFKRTYLPVTERQFHSFQELQQDPPEADVYIAGSDQIWNPLFENGRDPAFFLEFVKNGRKISYAASFAVHELNQETALADREYLQHFTAISVRESSGVRLIEKMGLKAVQVCDPVFLLKRNVWEGMITPSHRGRYIFVYDFDHSDLIKKIALRFKQKDQLMIVSYFSSGYADEIDESGPVGFLGNLANAELVISNSFHATAFSMIFHVPFYTTARRESINERMKDLLEMSGLVARYVLDSKGAERAADIDWIGVDKVLKQTIQQSETYLLGNV